MTDLRNTPEGLALLREGYARGHSTIAHRDLTGTEAARLVYPDPEPKVPSVEWCHGQYVRRMPEGEWQVRYGSGMWHQSANSDASVSGLASLLPVTDEEVEKACEANSITRGWGWMSYTEESKQLLRTCMRAALEASRLHLRGAECDDA